MRNINTRNIKIDTISKTITFEKSVTTSEIRQLISDLDNYNIIIKEAVVKEKTANETLKLSTDETKPSEFKEPCQKVNDPNICETINFLKPPFNPTCTNTTPAFRESGAIFRHIVNKPLFGFTCKSPCFCSGKCKTGWSANKSDTFKWNLNGR